MVLIQCIVFVQREPSEQPLGKRVLRRCVLCLTLGLLTSWFIAVVLCNLSSRASIGPLFFDQSTRITWRQSSQFGIDVFYASHRDLKLYTTPGILILRPMLDELLPAIGAAQRDIPAAVIAEDVVPREELQYWISTRAGWPFRCAISRECTMADETTINLDTTVLDIGLSADGIHVPVNFIGIGLLGNTVWWGLMFFAVSSVSNARRFFRVRHGQCGVCGYDMRHLSSTICPECGRSVD